MVQSADILPKMATLILFYYCWAHITQIILSNAIFLAHKEQMVIAYTEHVGSNYPHNIFHVLQS